MGGWLESDVACKGGLFLWGLVFGWLVSVQILREGG